MSFEADEEEEKKKREEERTQSDQELLLRSIGESNSQDRVSILLD